MEKDAIHPAAKAVKRLVHLLPGIQARIQKARISHRPPQGEGMPYLWVEDWNAILMKETRTPPHAVDNILNLSIGPENAKIPLYHINSILPTLMTWDKTRAVYRFDKDMREQLSKTESTGALPIELLKRLPSIALFIETPDATFPLVDKNGKETPLPSKGFWVAMESASSGQKKLMMIPLLDFTNAPPELVGHPYESSSIAALGIPIQGFTHISPNDSIQERMQANHLAYSDNPNENKIDEMTKWLGQALNMVLYLSSDRPDIERDKTDLPSNKKTKPLPGTSTPVPALKTWNVGIREGALWRAALSEAETHSSGVNEDGTKKRPHWRNAHWHRFWVGARHSEERCLTVKWVAQTLINAKNHHPEEGHELPVVRRRVQP